jgi:hypothetical protein
MASKFFPAKFPNTCVRCTGKIAVGEMCRFVARDSKELEHETCPGSPAPTPAARPTVYPRNDTPIYTYHRKLTVWGNAGRIEGEVDVGISTRGTPISDLEIAEVDSKIARAALRNARGELLK